MPPTTKRDKLKAQLEANVQREGFAFDALIGSLSEAEDGGRKGEAAEKVDVQEGRKTRADVPIQQRSAGPRKSEESTPARSTTAENTVVDSTVVKITTVEITSNFCRLDLDVSDRLAAHQTPAEQAVYNRLYRLCYGEGKDTCTVGLTRLTQATGIKSPKTVAGALRQLVEKGHIAVMDGHHNNPRTGTTYRVYLPGEIDGIESRTRVKRTPA